jgi:rhamnosyltransferase subunit B
MSRKVLLAWELGGGRGHIRILGWAADSLRQRGYEPVFAVRERDVIDTIPASIKDAICLQAPIWPAFRDYSIAATPGSRASFADIVGDLGLRIPDAVGSMVGEWQSLVESVRPAAVVADFAPACLLACRGRVPSIAIGDGFTLPPSTMETFTQFENGPPKYDERDLVGSVNEAMRNTSGATIERLPEIFAADRHCTGSFVELDPYSPHRRIATVAPWAPEWDRAAATRRTEVFAYLGVHPPLMATLAEALRYVVSGGVPVRLHIPSMDAATDAAFSGTGAIIEREPVPYETIHSRTRLAVSFGSFGFVSCALAAGIPQIVLPVGMAMECTAKAVQVLGTGRTIRLSPGNPLEGPLLGQVIIEACRDDELTRSAIVRAPDFARRLKPSPAEIVTDLLDELV